MALGGAVMGAGVVAPSLPFTKGSGAAMADSHTTAKMAFTQWQQHTVPNASSKGIEEVLNAQEVFEYQLLDG